MAFALKDNSIRLLLLFLFDSSSPPGRVSPDAGSRRACQGFPLAFIRKLTEEEEGREFEEALKDDVAEVKELENEDEAPVLSALCL